MLEVAEKVSSPARGPLVDSGLLRTKLKNGYFVLEALNGLAAAYYFNYLFFYTRKHFDFGNQSNLLLTALHGFFYMFAAYNAGRFARKYGYFFSLRLGFTGMGLAMVLGGLVPRLWGYSHTAMFAQFFVFVLWTITMCFTWPTLQALLTHDEVPTSLPRTAGIYNMIWASGAAVAYLTGGALLEKFGGETLFWLPAGLHLIQLLLLPRLQRLSLATTSSSPVADSNTDPVPPLNPRPIARAKTFLYLAWLANPFAYTAINGILPVIPRLSEHLGLTETYAGFVCSIWFWTRFGAFIWFWLWPGWHYRFGWLVGAFIALITSFVAILLSTQVWMLIAAQMVFGLAVGLIYYSSLFYSMDVGVSKGKSGGIHEAAIGVGVFTGPAVGVTALYFLPGHANSGTWAIGGILLLGLMGLFWIRFRKA